MTPYNNEYNFRTLNYLGSKLRLLDFIEENIVPLTPAGAGVCDLFAGSGCVTYKLSRLYPVYSCDIQTYSKVICSALLFQGDISDDDIKHVLSAFDTEESKSLKYAFHDIANLEEEAIKERNVELLTDIVEHGSAEVARLEKNDSSIYDSLCKVNQRLGDSGLDGEKSLVGRYFGGVYFSYRQAVDLDILLEAIHKIEDGGKRNVFLAALLSTASDIVDTVGKHFAQPIKARDSNGNIKRPTVYNKAIQDKTVNVLPLYQEWLKRYMELPKTNHHHSFFQGDYMECLRRLPSSVQTIYADPPYTREHYSRFYHVLETMTLRDCPEISTVKVHGETHVSNGIYRKDRYQSPFCIRSKAPGAFRLMFQEVAATGRNILLSYSPYDETKRTHPRVVTMKQLTELAKEFFANVEVISAGHFSHNKLNSKEHFLSASDEAEVLIVCSNKLSK